MDNDKRIQSNVTNELMWEPSVDAAHIGVTSHDGAISLTGHVPSYFAKVQAVKAAERVYGVRAVADELEVRLPSSHVHDDSSIAEAIAHNLKWNVAVPKDVKAKVAKAWVTLSGKVDTAYQKDAAGRAVMYQAGVQGVTNLIEVKKRAKQEDIERLINSAFQRNASLDARGIDVIVDDGTARLYGSVHSVQELRSARSAAFAAPGVKSVENHLVVTP